MNTRSASPLRKTATGVLAGAFALSLAACQAQEDTTYEADAVDESGGDLVVVPEGEGVAVDLPETPMTPVAEGEEAAEEPAAE
jgi:hypothetical protein